jgi:hypothetical protein
MRTLAAVVALAALAGCSTTHRMDFNDFNSLRVDCANKEAQIRFLESHMSTGAERLAALLETRSLWGSLRSAMDGTLEQKSALVDRKYDSVAREKIWELRTYCQ